MHSTAGLPIEGLVNCAAVKRVEKKYWECLGKHFSRCALKNSGLGIKNYVL